MSMSPPTGQENWLAYLEEASRNVDNFELCTVAIEKFRHATKTEPGSLAIWRAYCEFFHSLYVDSLNPRAPGSKLARWPNDELMVAMEMFTLDGTLQLWQQGYEAIRYRLNDSHVLWNRWIGLEMEQLMRTRTPEGIRRITHLYRNRLTTPHVTWDETASNFASFLSNFNNSAFENTMDEMTKNAQTAKGIMAGPRLDFEMRLAKAERENRPDLARTAFLEYLDWEINNASYHRRKNMPDTDIVHDVCSGLFSRALTGMFSRDEGVWEDYVVHLCSAEEFNEQPYVLEVLKRATDHCPWSGNLWARYILAAEQANTPFDDVERIKHSATASSELLEGGLESLVSMYIAWCGFLKRRAVQEGGEALDHADMGFAAALEDISLHGRKLYGKDEYKGDPRFRVERIFIEYLTDAKRSLSEARAYWNSLAHRPLYADNYIFWQQFFSWEMMVFGQELLAAQNSAAPNGNGAAGPSIGPQKPIGPAGKKPLHAPYRATEVLKRALQRRTLDWPEQLLEFYIQHCNEYESVTTIRAAQNFVRKVSKMVAKRREKERAAAYADQQAATEAAEAAAAAAATEAAAAAAAAAVAAATNAQAQPVAAEHQAAPAQAQQHDDHESLGSMKRKRDRDLNNDSAKRQRHDGDGAFVPVAAATAATATASSDSKPKRDRENTSVVVSGLPASVNVGAVKKYFREFGHIVNVMLIPEEDKTTTALIEFDSSEDANSVILLRNNKYFNQNQISVSSGFNLTVFVTNYPPTADEAFIRNLFKDAGDILSIRWPSLKYNTHRRFCYVTFRTLEGSAKAVALDGKKLEGRFRLEVKYSDPGSKRKRQGATSEGREVHVANVDGEASEDEVRTVFARYGTVESVRVLRALSGRNVGTAFVVYESAEQAARAVAELNNVKLRSHIIRVEISQQRVFKTSAKTTSSLGPADADSGSASASTGHPPASAEIDARSIALMGLPDTVNDARVKALVSPVGEIIKFVLIPMQGAAKIEFADEATAGRALMQLSGAVFEGRTLRTGPVRELRTGGEPANDAGRVRDSKTGSAVAAPTTKAAGAGAAKLFAPPKRAAGKGAKRGGLVVSSMKRGGEAAGPASGPAVAETKPAGGKSNADFKALFLASKKE
ncbi:hypothetical protein TD95_004370 [Thielaviopsis punctulata]|uniref:U4/U6 snRNA-associated-splicing factor PRP24 n=1 Tax=Thielaviopsis punctulata TaxID=72032 RepID=A0A0F4ZKN5_9PEZI|nr:hypothetical protein TD95_004370 [Thielaviopsis punctulata]